uniref:Ankyrin repeat domain 33 n=1 Tax=Anas platyrhynchos TaxID=8839 RepID=A0A8B9ZHW6_ANAPL
MTDERGRGERAAASNPELSYEEEEEEDESSAESELSDTCSILSDDSVYPCTELPAETGGAEDLSLYQCCLRNDAKLVRERLERGVSRREATELDINGRNGLMVACCKGFVDIVPLLRQCPHIDVNQQDKEGNTALMMAAQAGHITIVNYLLNYFPALDLDRRDGRGLTALMKAAVQGQEDCVAALLLAGADLQAVDPIKGKTAREWAAFTGRFETTVRIRSLLRRPRAEQFGTRYLPEWPALAGLVAKALSPKSRSQKLSEKIRSLFTFPLPSRPRGGRCDGPHGEDDHLPWPAPSWPPLAKPSAPTAPPRWANAGCRCRRSSSSTCQIRAPPAPWPGQPRATGQAVSEIRLLPPRCPQNRLLGFLPRRLLLLRGNSIFPGEHVPKIKLTKGLLAAGQQEGVEASCQGQGAAAAAQVEVQGAAGGEESCQGSGEREENEERGKGTLRWGVSGRGPQLLWDLLGGFGRG